MICPNCGTDNPNSSRFCNHCGEDLSSMSRGTAGRKCPECHFENDPDARFCMKCGAALAESARHAKQSRNTASPPKKARRERPKYRRRSWYESPATLVAIGVAVIFVFVLYGAKGHGSAESASTAPPGVILDPALKPAFDKVVDRFICGCGECTQPLWECNCPTAEAEKKMVRDDLEGGQEPPQIIDAVYKTYGHLANSSNAEAAAGTGSNYVPGSLSLPK